MRLDRFITLNVVRPWRRVLRSLNPQPSSLNHTWPIPVLMYHSISDDPEPNFSPYYKVNTSPAVFRQHMQLLADLGYRTITISDLVNRMGTNNKETKKQSVQASGDRGQESGARRPSTINHQPTTTPQPPTASQLSTLNSELPPSSLSASGGEGRGEVAPPLVALTFDDGFRDFYTQAFPILQEFGFTATMFLPTAFIGNDRRHFRPAGSRASGVRRQESGIRNQGPGIRSQQTINHQPSTDSQLPNNSLSASGGEGRGEVAVPQPTNRLSTLNSQLSTPSRPCLTWSEIRELHQAGIEFGSHTVNHPKLVELDLDAVRSELTESKAAIEHELGEPVTAFCYPYAFPQTNRLFVENLTRLLAETGYQSCATTKLGRCAAGDDPYSVRRLPANSLDDPRIFLAKLEGAYDWLKYPQWLWKPFLAALKRHLLVPLSYA